MLDNNENNGSDEWAIWKIWSISDPIHFADSQKPLSRSGKIFIRKSTFESQILAIFAAFALLIRRAAHRSDLNRLRGFHLVHLISCLFDADWAETSRTLQSVNLIFFSFHLISFLQFCPSSSSSLNLFFPSLLSFDIQKVNIFPSFWWFSSFTILQQIWLEQHHLMWASIEAFHPCMWQAHDFQ